MIWPWKTREVLIETLEWKTDVIRSKSDEQRFSIRPEPRAIYSFTHTLTEEQYNAARSIIRSGVALSVPDWTLSVNIGAISSGSSVAANYGESYSGLNDGDSVVLWESPTNYEECIIESDDSSDNFVLTTVVNNYTSARLMPLRSAVAPSGLSPTRTAQPYIQAQIDFHLTESADIGQSSYTKFNSHDVITDCPVIASQSFDESVEWPVDAVDNQVGYPSYINQRDTYNAKYMMRWHLFNRSDLYNIRRFLHSRKGRWKAFYMPSFKRDFTLAASIGASDTTITVFAPNGITDPGMATFDIEINDAYYRSVTSHAAGTPVNGLATIDLNISADLGASVGNGAKVSYLRFMRFDSDRVELNHAARAGTSIAIPCIEL